MSDLTEKWKNGELPSGYYYIIVKEEFSNRIDFYNSSATIWSYHSNDVINQVLAPVPSYEVWKSLNELVDCMSDTSKAFAHMLSPFTDDYFNGLTTKDIAELAKKSIRLTTQHCEDNAEIDKLKELLKECRDEFSYLAATRAELSKPMIRKISEVLK